MKNLSKSGFSLMEILIAIAIVGVLASLAATRLSAMGKKAELAGIEQALTSVLDSQRIYSQENGRYANYLLMLDVEINTPNKFSDIIISNQCIPTVNYYPEGPANTDNPLTLTINASGEIFCSDNDTGQCEDLGYKKGPYKNYRRYGYVPCSRGVLPDGEKEHPIEYHYYGK